MRLVEGTTRVVQVVGMASSTQFASVASGPELLPEVRLEVRQGATRPASYSITEVDFLIGNVPGCDLRVGANAGGVLCLVARHPTGVTLRKLAPTQTIHVNGHPVSNHELADGDHITLGSLDIELHITPPRSNALAAPDLDIARQSLQQQMQQFRAQVVQFENEKAAFERENARSRPSGSPVLLDELKDRERQLEERGHEIARQQHELARVRQEMAEVRKQLYDHYQDRRDQLAAMQDDLEKTKRELAEREQKVRLEEDDDTDRRQRDRRKQDENEKAGIALEQERLRVEVESRRLDEEQQRRLDEWARTQAAVQQRESTLADKEKEIDQKVRQYEADLVRLNRLEGTLETRQSDLDRQAGDIAKHRSDLQRDGAELQEQLAQVDEWRVKLAEEASRLAAQKAEQEGLTRQLAERSASLEGQQASLTVLRGRLERMREAIRTRDHDVAEQRSRLERREADLAAQESQIEQQRLELEAERNIHAGERQQWVERGVLLDAAVRQLKAAQEKLATDEERHRAEAAQLDDRHRRMQESETIVQARLAQLAETQARLDQERQALGDRAVALVQREEGCNALQEQLHRRAEEIGTRHKEITDRLQEYQARFAELDVRSNQVDERERELQVQIAAWRIEMEQKVAALNLRQTEVAGFDESQRGEMNQLAIQRQAHAEEKARFLLEQQSALEKLAQARAELETLRRDAQAFVQQMPDAEVRASAAVERLGDARSQLRNHLGEIHEYVRQCQTELEQLRGRLQGDLDALTNQEQTLRRSQDEHRLALAAFRQQLIDWQGQIAELKRLLARDSTRLERKQAQVDERTKEVEAESQRLAQQAEVLNEQEREVADRREEVDRHLVDMRQWYRHKLRELAGIPLVPDVVQRDMPVPVKNEPESETEDGIIPIGRNILSLASAADSGDQKLGQMLRESQLIDTDTLMALLAEARRQRRSLRQVLLASGVITLYQLALIEAGNVQNLMLGPVRILDRLRHTPHETVYRVFDPRRGTEAVLRHLAEADLADAVKPDEFRQRFAQAMLNDPHLANTLEVMELNGRPAVLQEWLSGLPATDWPPLAAAPGVCYRLLTQAAQGLTTAHHAGVVHGHLSDAMLLMTGEGVLKIRGLGEPPWLSGIQHDNEPTARDDLRALGKIAAGWCTPTGVRKGAKTKPLPDALVSILYRLAADGEPGYREVKELSADLQTAAGAIPANTEAWDRLVKYVRDHGAAEATLRRSA